MAEVSINLPIPLRKYAEGKSRITITATTVYEALMGLNQIHESMSSRLLESESKSLRKFIKVYLGGKDIRSLNGLDTELEDKASVEIVTAFAGG